MQTWRNNLTYSNPYGAWTAVWDRNGISSQVPGLYTNGNKVCDLGKFQLASPNTVQGFMWGYALPAGIQAGQYNLQFPDSPQTLPIRVYDAPNQDTVLISAPGSADAVSRALNAGKRVLLGHGRHVWQGPIIFNGQGFIDGQGVTVTAVHQDGNYADRMIAGGGGLTIRDVTFEPIDLVQHSDGTSYNTQYVGCTFKGGRLGWGMREIYCVDCVFAGGGVNCDGPDMPTGLFHRCLFKNTFPGENAHAFYIGGPNISGRVCMVDCIFDNTDRGPCFNTNHGPFNDNCFVGVTCRGIRRDNNGGECFLAEGANPFDNNIVVHFRAYDCDSAAPLFFDAACRNNLFFDTITDGGLGAWLAGWNGADQSGNVFDRFEFRWGAGVRIGWRDFANSLHGTNIRNNVFRNGVVIGHRPSGMANQGWSYPWMLEQYASVWPHPDLDLEQTRTNTLENVIFCDLPTGVQPVPLKPYKDEKGWVLQRPALSTSGCYCVRGSGSGPSPYPFDPNPALEAKRRD